MYSFLRLKYAFNLHTHSVSLAVLFSMLFCSQKLNATQYIDFKLNENTANKSAACKHLYEYTQTRIEFYLIMNTVRGKSILEIIMKYLLMMESSF